MEINYKDILIDLISDINLMRGPITKSKISVADTTYRRKSDNITQVALVIEHHSKYAKLDNEGLVIKRFDIRTTGGVNETYKDVFKFLITNFNEPNIIYPDNGQDNA